MVERRSLRQLAIERIKAAILDHTLEPGEELRDEELQEWLGMSRTPVREALIELARIGLVETSPQRWTRVANPDPETALFDLQTMGALLGGVVRVTVPTLSAAASKQLTTALARVFAALEAQDPKRYNHTAGEFFREMREYCPNPVLLRATEDIIEATAHRLSLSRIVVNRDWDELTNLFTNLRDGIAERDGVAAQLALALIFELTPAKR